MGFGGSRRRRWFRGLIPVLALLLALGLALPASAQHTIWEDREEEPVTRGVTYALQWRFTREGWLAIHILEVALQAQDLKFETLYNTGGLPSARTLPALAQQRGAVAAINTDFFYRQGGHLAPVGPVVSQEEGLVANANTGGNTGVLAIDNDHQVAIGYWSTRGQLNLPGGGSIPLGGLNKPGSNYARAIAYTPEWGARSPGGTSGTVTVVAQHGSVVAVGQGARSIPDGGFVVVGGGDAAGALRRLNPGDPLTFDYHSNPNWEEFVHATGGGGIIVRDGQVVTEGHQVAGRHPRSAAGVSADQSTLYLVTVDGRQAASYGLNQGEMGQLMRELGAHQALNLDGGGSSTLLARPLGGDQAEVRNSPSDGSPRAIVSGLGIRNTAAPGAAAHLVLEAEDTNVPLEGSRTLKIRAFDGAYNPAALPDGSPRWRVEPEELGRMEGMVFVPETSGRGTISAEWGDATGEIDVRVLGPTRELRLDPPSVSVSPGSERYFRALAVDSRAYRARVENRDLTWEVQGGVGTVSDGRLQATGTGTGAVVARMGAVEGRAAVNSGASRASVHGLDSIAGLEFLARPEAVAGELKSARPPQEVPGRSGQAVALEYDFTATLDDATRAACLELAGEGLELPAGAEMLSLQVLGDGQGHRLRGRVRDASGRSETVEFAQSLDGMDWQGTEAALPAGLEAPVFLERLCLEEPDSGASTSGTIYLADLEALGAPAPPEEQVPASALDEGARLDRAAEPAGTTFLVLGNISSRVSADELASSIRRARERHDAAWAVSTGPLPSGMSGRVPLVDGGGRPRSVEEQEARLAFLLAREGGLRRTDSNQWFWLQELLAREGDQPLLFFLDGAPFAQGDLAGAQFRDAREAELLRRLLSEHQEDTDREVWVFSGGLDAGRSAWSRMQEGVQYLGVPPVQQARGFTYLAVTMTPEGMRFQELKEDDSPPRPPVTVTVDGVRVDFPDVEPRIENGRTLVPLRGVFEAMGATVDWEHATRTVIAARGETRVQLVTGQAEMEVNGEKVELEVPGRIENGRTLVPLRAISEALGDQVDWDQATRTVIITLL